jgi:hypothetical protein
MRDLLGALAEQHAPHDSVHVEAVGERLPDALVLEGGRGLALHVPADVGVVELLPLV